MSQLNSQLRFNADGTPRRRYELDQAPEGRAALATTIGLVLASTVALVKNVMFPAHALEPAPIPGYASADAVSAPIESGTAQSDSDIDPLRTQTSSDDVAEVHVPVVRASLPEFKSVPVPTDGHAPAALHAASSHLASNDNKALYGAAPGHGVSFASSDAVHIPASGGQDAHTAAARARTSGDDGGYVPGHKAPSTGNHVTPPIKLDNTAPVVSKPVSLGNTFINQVLVIGLAALVANATDADADALSVVDVTPSSGTITANDDGTWSYMADPGATGDVTFSYAVSDGHTATPATATLALLATAAEPAAAFTACAGSSIAVTEVRNDFAAPIPEKIMLTAPAQLNIIDGTAENDVIAGSVGADLIHAGPGNDVITAGTGNDVVYGDGGDDTFVATLNDGDDTYDGGDGTDILDLSAIAPDTRLQAIHDHTADTVIDLEAGTANGGQIGNDTIVNIENVKAGAGDDTIKGDAHDNVLDGGAGSDKVDGGEGDDVITATADGAVDDYHGGKGNDTYDASHTSANAIIDLSEGTAESLDLGHDTIREIENVNGGGGGDTIVANDEVNVLSGGAGDDLFVFHTTASIGHGEGHHDVILDFAVGDKIDISDISKEFADALDDAFHDTVMQDFIFIKNADKFSKPGELKLVYHDDTDATILQGNIDFNGDAEFELEFKGHVTLNVADFHHH